MNFWCCDSSCLFCPAQSSQSSQTSLCCTRAGRAVDYGSYLLENKMRIKGRKLSFKCFNYEKFKRWQPISTQTKLLLSTYTQCNTHILCIWWKSYLLLHSVDHCMQLEIPNIPQRRKKIRRTMPQRKRMKTTMKTSSYLMSMTTAPVILGSSSLRLAGLIVITGKICYFVLIFKEAFQLRRRSSRSYNVSLSVCAYK